MARIGWMGVILATTAAVGVGACDRGSEPSEPEPGLATVEGAVSVEDQITILRAWLSSVSKQTKSLAVVVAGLTQDLAALGAATTDSLDGLSAAVDDVATRQTELGLQVDELAATVSGMGGGAAGLIVEDAAGQPLGTLLDIEVPPVCPAGAAACNQYTVFSGALGLKFRVSDQEGIPGTVYYDEADCTGSAYFVAKVSGSVDGQVEGGQWVRVSAGASALLGVDGTKPQKTVTAYGKSVAGLACNEVPTPATTPCAGICGGQSATGCWCDQACVAGGSCCEDACTSCGACETLPKTIKAWRTKELASPVDLPLSLPLKATGGP